MVRKDLVRYMSRCGAQKPNCHSLYEMAAKYDWDAEDVQAFLRSQKLPPKKMLRQMLTELDITDRYAEELLQRSGQRPAEA